MSLQKERYIQISKVDEEERKRREQQKLEKEQVSYHVSHPNCQKFITFRKRAVAFCIYETVTEYDLLFPPTGGAK